MPILFFTFDLCFDNVFLYGLSAILFSTSWLENTLAFAWWFSGITAKKQYRKQKRRKKNTNTDILLFNYWLLHGNGVGTKWKFNCPICCRAFASRFHYWPPPAVAMSHHRSSVRPTILHSNYINKEIAYFSISLKTYWCYSIVTQRQTHFIRLYRNVKVPEIDVIAASIYVRLFYSTQSSFYTQRIRNVLFFCLNNMYNAFFSREFFMCSVCIYVCRSRAFFIILVESEQWTLDRFYFCFIMIEKWNFNIAMCTKHDGSTMILCQK